MSKPSYRALQLALRIFSVLFAIGGLFMIFGSRELVLRVLLHPPEAEVSTLLLFLLKEMGGMVLMVSAILFRAARDPERNIAVVDGLIVGPARPHDNASAFAPHLGRPTNLSWTPCMGTVRDPARACGVLLLLATTGSAMAA